MKRSLQIFAALLLLASCGRSSEPILPNDDSDSVISFSISVADSEESTKGATRAADVSTAAQMATVGLYCAHTGESSWESGENGTTFDKMTNKLLTYDTATGEWVQDGDQISWDYATVADKYSFRSYSPHSTTTTTNTITPNITSGELVVVYTPATTAADQVDLLVAQPRTDIYPQMGGVVYLTYDHALSCIDFQAIGESVCKVVSIELSDIVTSGSVTHNGTSPTWNDLATTTAKYSAGVLASASQTHTESEAKSVVADDGYLMLIPQTISSSATVTIGTSVDGGDTEYNTFDLATSAVGEWKASTRYTYTFTVEAGKVKFNEDDVSVNPWVDDVSYELDVPSVFATTE